jgi:peptidoglycan/LPS O-acetylase OafA/YrhL
LGEANGQSFRFGLSAICAADYTGFYWQVHYITYRLWLLRGIFIFSALNLLYVAKHSYYGDLSYAVYNLPTLFLLAALVCLFVPSARLEKLGQWVVKGGIRLGSLSYGIYYLHFPLLLLFSRITVFSGIWLTFAVRFVLLMLLTVGLGYWLEKVVQPWGKAFFFKNAPVIIPKAGQHSKLAHSDK